MIKKRCTDCKYTRGIGSDFWCGEGHTEYEVFGAETNCPYYEYHDWSKGIPSETEKRFKLDYPRCPNCKTKLNSYPKYDEYFEIYECSKCGFKYRIKRKRGMM